MLHTADVGRASRQQGPGPPPLPENLLGMLGRWEEAARAPLAQVDESFLSAPHSVSLSPHREQVLSGAVITGCRAGAPLPERWVPWQSLT